MKFKRTAAAFLVAGAAVLTVSCHTETPLNIDSHDPQAEIMMVYSSTDTLYNSADTAAVFTDFQQIILEGEYELKVKLSDNQNLYRLTFCAEDKVTGKVYPIKKVLEPSEGVATVSFNYKDFPVVQEENPQEFYLSVKIEDETENSFQTPKFGFKVAKLFPFNQFYDELGLIKETRGDSIDFREKNWKLAFIQFMSKGCLSCVEEAREMKAMYADTLNYDQSKYSHSLMGNYTFTEVEFNSFAVKTERLPFDCFWDSEDSIKNFFEALIGKEIENEVFAVLPNGKIIQYDYLQTNFENWIHSMYQLAYPGIQK
jgi:hypothetical protein